MHETGLLRAAVSALVAAAEGPVGRVRLAIGAGVDREAAEAAWRTASAGTPAAAARVEWLAALDRLSCLTCGGSYEGDRLTRCPTCGGDGLVVEPAPEIVIVDWSVGRHEARPEAGDRRTVTPAGAGLPRRPAPPPRHRDRAVWPA